MTLLGYADRRVGRPGDTVTVMATTEADDVSAELIHLRDGTPSPQHAPARTARLDPPLVATGPGKRQRSVVGSRADLPLPEGWHRAGRS